MSPFGEAEEIEGSSDTHLRLWGADRDFLLYGFMSLASGVAATLSHWFYLYASCLGEVR